MNSPKRVPVHQRRIETWGFLRQDGLWDIEGRLTDTKDYAFENTDRGIIPVGEPLHEMFLRLTVTDDYEIVAVYAETRFSPYRMCPAITDSYQGLVGLRIAAGFNREVKKRVGGIKGCTHITEIVRILATVAMQTIRPSSKNFLQNHDKNDVLPNMSPGSAAALKNSCYAFAEDSVVSLRMFGAGENEAKID